MVASKGPSANADGIKVTNDGRITKAPAPKTGTPHNDGGAGPKSALKGGAGSPKALEEARERKLRYSVQIHSDTHGLEVFEPIEADSGDEAAQKALAKKAYLGASVRGVTAYSDPDPNSLGGEREAANMYANAQNDGHIINTLGTDANALATEKLGKQDVKELGA